MRLADSLLTFALLLLSAVVTWAAQDRRVAPSQPSADPDVVAAKELMERKDYRHAIDSLEKPIRFRPRCDPEVYIMLATCRLYVEERQEAVAVCERALALYPDLARLEKFYVSLLRAACTNKQRTAKLTEKHQQQPGSLIYKVGLSEALLAEDPYSPRIEALISAAAGSLPEDAEVHYLYGRWACLNDRQELAVRELTKALALTSANDEAEMQIYTYLAVAYDHRDQPDKADAAFRKSLASNERLARSQPGPLMEYVSFLQRQERESEAQNVVLRILQVAPSFGPAHLERARFLGREQKLEEAVAEGELALQYAGTEQNDQRAAHALLARTCALLGRMEEAQVHRKWVESH